MNRNVDLAQDMSDLFFGHLLKKPRTVERTLDLPTSINTITMGLGWDSKLLKKKRGAVLKVK